MSRKKPKPAEELAAIAVLLNRQEWNADTLDEIAAILRRAGYVIEDTEPGEGAK